MERSNDASIRPNQIFAVSLRHTMLSPERARSVVESVQNHLLTPYGLRTLAPSDPNYRGRYTGDQASRDGAYHQGTVWPWLPGPFLTAYLKVNGHREAALQQAEEWIEPLRVRMLGPGTGQMNEIFEGDMPHASRRLHRAGLERCGIIPRQRGRLAARSTAKSRMLPLRTPRFPCQPKDIDCFFAPFSLPSFPDRATQEHILQMPKFYVRTPCCASSTSFNIFARAMEPAEPRFRSQKLDDGVQLTMARGTMRLKVCSSTIIRVMYVPSAEFPTRPDRL